MKVVQQMSEHKVLNKENGVEGAWVSNWTLFRLLASALLFDGRMSCTVQSARDVARSDATNRWGGGHFWHPPQGGRVAASMTAHFIGKHWQGARVSYHTLHCISHIALASGKSAILEGLSPFEIIILHWFFNKFCEQRRNLKEYISEICYVAWWGAL